jgi:hypothetical protein
MRKFTITQITGGITPSTTEGLAFFTATGLNLNTTYFPGTVYAITGTAILNAINNFVTGLKTDNLLSKLIALYPFVGDNYDSQKFNLINPLDTNTAFRLSKTGTLLYYGDGVTFNGSNNYFNTHITPLSQGAYNDFCVGSYQITPSQQGRVLYGVYDGSIIMDVIPSNSTYEGLYNIPSDSDQVYVSKQNDNIGLIQFSSVNGYLYKSINCESDINYKPLTNTTLPDKEIYLGCLNNNGTASAFDATSLSAWYYGYGLTEQDNINLAIRLDNLMIALKRKTYTTATKTITLNNTGNVALTDYMAEIDFTSPLLPFSKVIAGTGFVFLDGSMILDYYIAFYDNFTGSTRAFMKVNIPANSIKTITLNIG